MLSVKKVNMKKDRRRKEERERCVCWGVFFLGVVKN